MNPNQAGSRLARVRRGDIRAARAGDRRVVRPTASTGVCVRAPADPAAHANPRESASQISDRLTPWLNTGAERAGLCSFFEFKTQGPVRRASLALFSKRRAETPR